jgi:hypothetical protein
MLPSPWIKEPRARADHRDASGARRGGEPMSVLMSWARSTLANMERALDRNDRWFDCILVGAVTLLVIAIAYLVFVV